MTLDNLFSNYLNGDPFHDTICIAIMFTIMFEFYKICSSTIFTLFKK